MVKYFSKKIAGYFNIDIDVCEKVLKHGSIYFVELLSLWIVTTAGNFNLKYNFVGFSIELMQIQTLGFLIGAFVFGWVGEMIPSRIRVLTCSLVLYALGNLMSIIYFLGVTVNLEGIPTNLSLLFAVARFVTCFGISGGIGINLTIIASSVKDGKHSVPILMFTAFGVLGTFTSSLFLFFFENQLLPIFIIGFLLSLYQIIKLRKQQDKDYFVEYTFTIGDRKDYWSRALSFLLLGLPTFFLAGILASKANLFIDAWFEDFQFIKSYKNPSSLFLGIQYLGFSLICIIFSIPFKKEITLRGKSYKLDLRYLVSERRGYILLIGTFFQLIFVGAFVTNYTPNSVTAFILILISGAGIGINWGIIMTLIFEQDEFKNSKVFSATIIPNLIRFSLFLILIYPALLNIEITTLKNLQGLTILVYIPFVLASLLFKYKGELFARYNLNKSERLEKIKKIIDKQKFNINNFEKNSEDDVIDFLLNDLKNDIREVMNEYDFDLINFYFNKDGENLRCTNFCSSESKNNRANTIKRILLRPKTHGISNLLEVAQKKRLNFIVIHDSIHAPEENRKFKDTFLLDISKETEEIIKSINLNLTPDEEEALSDNIDKHKKASNCDNSDYFVYIIRPIEDINGLSVHLVMVCSHFINNEELASLQNLIDLILIKYNRYRYDVFTKQINNNQKEIQQEKNNVADLREHIKELEEKLEIKNKLISDIQDWKKLVGDDDLERVFNEVSNFLNANDSMPVYNDFFLLKAQWASIRGEQNIGVLSFEQRSHKLNEIRRSLMNFLDKLKK